MADFTWEWDLPEGSVRASLDGARRYESVWVGPRLACRIVAGSRPEGHDLVLPGGASARVVFDPSVPACALSREGAAVAPTRTHAPPRRRTPVLVAFALAAIVLAGITVRVAMLAIPRGWHALQARSLPKVEPSDFALTQRYATPDGVLVAHYPASFAASVGKSEPGRYVSLTVTRGGGSSAVGFVALLTPASTDVRELDRLVTKGVRAEWSRKDLSFTSTSERDEPCFGGPGVITEGTLENQLASVRTWQCTFVRGNKGFHFFYLVPVHGDPDEEKVLQKILEATEIDLRGE